jgi:hypothetical protein
LVLFLKILLPLKPLGQMNQSLEGSIYGGSSMKIAHELPVVAMFLNGSERNVQSL